MCSSISLAIAFGSIISLFKEHDIHLSSEAKERDATVVSAFYSVTRLVFGMTTTVCQSCAFPEHQATFHTGVSQRTPLLKTEHFELDIIAAFGSSDGIFLPQMHLL